MSLHKSGDKYTRFEKDLACIEMYIHTHYKDGEIKYPHWYKGKGIKESLFDAALQKRKAIDDMFLIKSMYDSFNISNELNSNEIKGA